MPLSARPPVSSSHVQTCVWRTRHALCCQLPPAEAPQAAWYARTAAAQCAAVECCLTRTAGLADDEPRRRESIVMSSAMHHSSISTTQSRPSTCNQSTDLYIYQSQELECQQHQFVTATSTTDLSKWYTPS